MREGFGRTGSPSSGHTFERRVSHSSTHEAWKMWPHGSLRTRSPAERSSMQIEHCCPESRDDSDLERLLRLSSDMLEATASASSGEEPVGTGGHTAPGGNGISSSDDDASGTHHDGARLSSTRGESVLGCTDESSLVSMS